jgi:NADPH:quinone reductase-like Zn-dependent oxidoreductase
MCSGDAPATMELTRTMEVTVEYSRVIVIARGGPATLTARTENVPAPAPGQVRVRVAAAGVSFGDVLLRAGVIPNGPKPPFVPGYDITGTVDAVGADVTGLEAGQLVTALLKSGGYAEFAIVAADRLVPVPAGLDPVRVAAVVLNYFVAYQMLHRVTRIRPGQRMLVHGGAGGVGVALIQLGTRAGAEVWATCSEGKRHWVTGLGAHAIDYRSEDFLPAVRGLPGGGVHAVFDPVGGGHFRRSYRALAAGGTLVGFGQSDAYRGGRPSLLTGAWGMLGGIVAPSLVPDGKRAVFYNAWSLDKKEPAAYREDVGAVLALLGADVIAPLAVTEFPLSEAAKAHELLEHESPTGKIVLTA